MRTAARGEQRVVQVVPWGRSAAEYTATFALTPQDLGRCLLDCGGGSSSFTAELTAQGRSVTACDPLYVYSAAQIRHQMAATVRPMTALTEATTDHFRWERYGSPRQVARLRLRTMLSF